ncbi:MAG TPA: hypothetical protein VJ506_07635, partial [Candidatus Limnocylindrales bacterium]|nr:hypothetical protein [Candidatus Limnocylindrales bacterium]
MTSSTGPATAVGVASLRPFDPARDYAPVAELICEANRHDGVDWLPSAEGLEHDLAHDGSFRPAIDGVVAAVDGRLVGLAATGWRRRGDKV